MSLQIVEYSSDLYTGLYKLLKDVYNSNINEIDLEKNYINNSKKIYIAMFEDNIVGCAFLEIKMDYIRLTCHLSRLKTIINLSLNMTTAHCEHFMWTRKGIFG